MKSIIICALIILSQKAWSENKTITIKNCQLKFETTGSPTLIRIEGKSEKGCSGTLTHDGSKVIDSDFTMPTDKLDTGIPLRNKHLRENYLHAAKFPIMKMKLKSVENLKEQLAGNFKKFSKFEGILEVHGKEAPAEDSTYEVQGNKVTAKFVVDVLSHGVERPSFMGVKVVDKVHITLTFEI
jgi:polyisoprenoid-binding protein YceI